MSWNHRVIKHEVPRLNEDETVILDFDPWLGIHEVYYNKDGSLWMYTKVAVGVTGETLQELDETLKRMGRCLALPILTPEDFATENENNINEIDPVSFGLDANPSHPSEIPSEIPGSRTGTAGNNINDDDT